MPDTSSPPSFNLIEERWLPVTSLAAEPRLASLRELLREPAAYRGLSTTVPTEFLALHRLLLAICHRAIGPGDLYQRSNLLQAWPSHQIMAYLDRWSERFDTDLKKYPDLGFGLGCMNQGLAGSSRSWSVAANARGHRSGASRHPLAPGRVLAGRHRPCC